MSSQGTRATGKVDRGGTHRSLAPAETLRRLRPFFDTLGITRVADITRLDDVGIPTVLVTRPNSRSFSTAPGKGLDLDAARASGVMQAVEHFHAEHVELPLKYGSYVDLARGHRLADASRLPRCVPAFDVHSPMLWIEAEGLNGDRAWVPYELVHLNLTLPAPPGTGFFPLGSNGLAAGNTRSEAIAQAVFELVERDASALFAALSDARRSERRVDLESVDDPDALELLARLRASELEIAVWDVSSDVGIASFHAAIVEKRFDPRRRVGKACGFGCHNHRGVALCRALTEAAERRLTRITGSLEEVPRTEAESSRTEAAIESARGELAASIDPPRRFGEVPHAPFTTPEEDLKWAKERLDARGLDELWIVDLSRAELPVHVVRALVPGLEGSTAVSGYMPGARALAAGAGA